MKSRLIAQILIERHESSGVYGPDHAFGPIDPARRKRQLAARPKGHDTAMIKKRSDDHAKGLVAQHKAKQP